MLPPAALLALSLLTSVTGPVCPNPLTATPGDWVPNPVCAAPSAGAVGLTVTGDLADPNTAGPLSSNLSAAAPPLTAPAAVIPAREPHVSVRDYTTEVQPASFNRLPVPIESQDEVSLSVDEADLLNDINLDRVSRGLQALALDPLLVAIARSHSEDMCRRAYFDHIAPAPGPVSPMDRYLASLGHRPDYAMVGENIYYRSITDTVAQSATEANDAFMQSPGHRANILQPLYTKVGIGIYRNPQTGEFWVTEMFLRDEQ